MMASADRPAMRVAYFVNQYPEVSHSFIHREIRALERRGLTIDRYAGRGLGRCSRRSRRREGTLRHAPPSLPRARVLFILVRP